jgi:hypothetical protein
MKIAEGLHRIGSDIVNSYLVVDADGVTIIDAGLPRYWNLLSSELARIGLTLDDVRALILTHGDSDHIGFAGRLSREKGIPAYLHPADADRARLEVKKPSRGWGPVKAGPLAGFLWYSAREGGLRNHPAGELRPAARRPRLAPDHSRPRPHARQRGGARPGGRRAVPRRHHDDPQRAHRRDRPQARTVHAATPAGPGVARPHRRGGRDLGPARSRTSLGRRRDRGGTAHPASGRQVLASRPAAPTTPAVGHRWRNSTIDGPSMGAREGRQGFTATPPHMLMSAGNWDDR